MHTCDHDHPEHIAPLHWQPAQLDAAAQMCHALSDPSRLRLLLWLARDGELCVSELVRREQGKASSVSARLQTLHGARLITRRRDARHIFYALADEHVRALLLNILEHASEGASPAPPPKD